jgi:hypothetical protein
MTGTTRFIGELRAAAMHVELRTAHEHSGLLDRAIDAIREMHDEIGISDTPSGKDVVIHLQTVSARARHLPWETIRYTLLDAAAIIEALDAALDVKGSENTGESRTE